MNDRGKMMTFGGHLDALRGMLFRILGVTAAIGVLIFTFKEETFNLLLAPTNSRFATWQLLQRLGDALGMETHIGDFHVQLISTELASQFTTHVTTSALLAMLVASPYIVFELFRFVSPALYARERRYSIRLGIGVYVLFLLGVVLSYYVVFPVSFRFLGTYQVAERVVNQINISSYISSFVQLTFLMGLLFQLPVVIFFLTKTGVVSADFLRRMRRQVILLICIVAAIITPPDAFSLLLVATPVWLLYEASVWIAARWA